MTEFVWPNGVRMSSVDWRHISNSESFQGAYGIVQTVSRPGDRLGCTITVRNSTGDERSKLRALSAALRGSANRIRLRDMSYRRRGSFSGAELFTNADFSTTTGWTADFGTLSTSDNVMRLTASQGGGSNTQFRQAVTLASYTPYVLRSFIADGDQSSGLSIGPALTLNASFSATDYQTTRGYRVASGVSGPSGSQTQFPVVFSSTSGFTGGAFIRCPFTTMSQCALVDGGGTLLLQSRSLDNGSWTKTALATVTANTEIAPDATMTGEALIPTVANTSHLISQAVTVTSSAQDLNIRGFFKAGGYNFVLLAMTENTSSTQSFQVFNLGTGAVGTTTATGANWANLRTAIVSMGNGWYYCSLIIRKTNAATSVTGAVYVQSTDSGSGFAGNATNFIGAVDVSLSASSAHARPTTSTTTAVAAASQSTSSIYLKGLTASTTGLVLPGDQVEVDGQLKMVTAPLDSDASGRGYLQLDTPPARTLADNTPVIFEKPMAKFYLARDAEYPSEPGTKSSNKSNFTFEFEQDLSS